MNGRASHISKAPPLLAVDIDVNFQTDIQHVVVVMMENRSFDSILGWLYKDSNNVPPLNIPPKANPTFDGLRPETFFNVHAGKKVFASHPPTPWPPKNNASLVPDPDPHEDFDNMTNQIFGTTSPGPDAVPNMSGFLPDYADLTTSPEQIMQSFGPEDANVSNELSRNFAVCDAWFASCPCQTWPNRGFVHTGSSDGHINNDHYELYDIDTIFNVLEARGISWGVFHDSTVIPSLTYGQFLPRLCVHEKRFYRMSSFYRLCSQLDDYTLPTYSFVEPRFLPEFGLFKIDYPEDSHPPHNVCRGEQFLADVYNAIRTSPYRDKIMLVITYDEHGGLYDHVPPPSGAAPPEPGPVSRDGRFHFDRFGVRVPAIVISSYVRPGTVFRTPEGSPPYDHTSILASLRDWLGLTGLTNLRLKLKEWWFAKGGTKYPFLPSPRIKAAPTLWPVLSLSTPDNPWPDITAKCRLDTTDADLETRLSDVQKSLLATAKRRSAPQTAVALQQQTAIEAKQQVTYADALTYLHPELSSRPRSP